MTLANWQTGKGCCQDNIRGQLSLHGPVLNKVPINSPFISDRNQCTSDWVSQLTLSTAGKEEREEEKGTRAKDWDGKENMGDDSRGWAAVSSSGLVFLLICRGRRVSVEWEDQIPTKWEAPGVCSWRHSDRKQRPPISQEEVSVCVCVCVRIAVAMGRELEFRGSCCLPHRPRFVHIIY